MSKIKPSFKSKQTNKQKTPRPWGTMWLLPSSHPFSLQPEPHWPFLSDPSVSPPLSPQGLCTHKSLWLKFPLQHTPKELLFIPRVSAQASFLSEVLPDSGTRSSSLLRPQQHTFLCSPCWLHTHTFHHKKAMEGRRGLFCSPWFPGS